MWLWEYDRGKEGAEWEESGEREGIVHACQDAGSGLDKGEK